MKFDETSTDAGRQALAAEPSATELSGESSDATRSAILDAVARCFAVQGWAGTNMSLVARETGMTRGKIQYYFPVLEDLKYAAIERLYDSWRHNYFGQIAQPVTWQPHPVLSGAECGSPRP